MSFQAYPKVELHRHLEGAIRISTLWELAHIHDSPLPTDSADGLHLHAQVLEPMSSLQAVLDAFGLFQQAFQSISAVERISFEAVEDAALDGIRLLELRFSPGFMAVAGRLDWDSMMDAVMCGVRRAQEAYHIAVGLIAIVSRSLGPDSAADTVAFALNWREALVGFDLADSEDMWPSEAFAKHLAPLHKAGIPLTIHSGENTGPEHIRKSVELLGARRIGHGVSIIHDSTLLEQMIEKGVTFEMCPTSNVRTRAVASIECHPAADLLRRGLQVCLNTDDPGLFDVTLSGELTLAMESMGFDRALLDRSMGNALRGSFLNDGDKAAIAQELRQWGVVF